MLDYTTCTNILRDSLLDKFREEEKLKFKFD